MLPKRLRILLLFFLTFVVSLTVFAKPVSAHVLKSDHGIGAVLHIDPDDDPFVDQVANFYFEFKDQDGKFKISNCQCIAVIEKDNQQLSINNLSYQPTNTSSSGAFAYTFPTKGVYQIIVTGISNNNSFPSFKLVYDLRISREASPTKVSTSLISRYLHFFIIGIIVLIFLVVYLINKKRK